MRSRKLFFVLVFCIHILACSSQHPNRVQTNPGLYDWEDIVTTIERFSAKTTYEEIIIALGKPYREFATPSLPEEYCLYFEVLGELGQMFWIMLDTQTKRFLYWSNERQIK